METRGRALLTGAGGLLARDLWPALEAAGYEVTALTHAELDVVDAGAVVAALDSVQPGVLINAAGYSDVDGAERQPEAAERANAAGPEVLARACRTRGVTLVQLSTDYVFDGEAGRPYREDDPPAPLGVYGQTKLEGERRVRDTLPDGHLIVRTAWLYGLGGPCFPRAILDRAREHEELEVVEDQVGCPTWTADVSRAIAALLDAGARGTVHAAAPDHVSRHGWAEALCEEACRHGSLRTTTVRRLRSTDRPGEARRPRWSVLDSGRLQGLTGDGLPPWRERLAPFVRQLVKVSGAVLLPMLLWAAVGTGCGPCAPQPGPRAIPIQIPPSTGVTATAADQPLDLTILIDRQGFTVGTPAGALGRSDGEPGPTVPCAEGGCTSPQSYDYEELGRILREVKNQYPEEDDLLVRAEEDVTYEVIVQVLDAARGDGDGGLFPNVALEVLSAP